MNILLISFLIVLVPYQVTFASYKYIKAEWNIIVDPTKYPVSAVSFLKQNGIKGNVLFPFDWGEYTIWKLYPDSRVSIDGRFRTVYPEKILTDHFVAAVDESKLRELLEKYPPDIILGRQNLICQRLISTLDGWIYVYSDPTSIIFIRNSSSQKDVLERLRRKDLVYPDKNTSSFYFP